MESIGTLAGGIAHDFNNALTPIMVQTELAKLTIPADNPVQEGLDEIMKAGHRAKDLVKQILTYSRQSQQQRVSIDLTPMVKESLKLLRSSIPTTIEIRQDIETDPCTVLADPTQMQQIVMNLCTNASQAMQEMGSVLEVSLKPVELEKRRRYLTGHLGGRDGRLFVQCWVRYKG
jgi:signal transduction histidine kinase